MTKRIRQLKRFLIILAGFVSFISIGIGCFQYVMVFDGQMEEPIAWLYVVGIPALTILITIGVFVVAYQLFKRSMQKQTDVA